MYQILYLQIHQQLSASLDDNIYKEMIICAPLWRYTFETFLNNNNQAGDLIFGSYP